ncbi:MAG TPA: c-type cytochrome [Steroidobacter sp.]
MGTPHFRRRVVCAAAAVLLTGLSSTVFVSAEPQSLERRHTTPVKAVDRATVDRGRYLMRTAGCNDCHTPGYVASAGNVEESKWLTGDSVGWSGPWGTTYPINLRLFMQSLSADQWLQIARKPARPPMPWFALRDMTDEDLLAIYYYVRSLGAAGSPAPEYLPPGVEAHTPVVKFPE